MVYQYGPLVKRSKTLASHASNMGSNPVRVTKKKAFDICRRLFSMKSPLRANFIDSLYKTP